MTEVAHTLTIAAAAFDADAESAAFRAQFAKAGAIATFCGQVRGATGADAVKSLYLEHYPEFTEQTIDEFARRALDRWPLVGLRIVHRVGHMAPGDAIVFVAAAADHRRAAFEAVDFVMDYLKSEAPFWKQEITKTGARWIEPRDADYADKKRWQGAVNARN